MHPRENTSNSPEDLYPAKSHLSSESPKLQHHQQQQQHNPLPTLTTPSSQAPLFTDPNFHSIPEIDTLSYSPISPRTRCPSLSESLISSGSCPSPHTHGLVTPNSDRGGNSGVGLGLSLGSAMQLYEGPKRYEVRHVHRGGINKSYNGNNTNNNPIRPSLSSSTSTSTSTSTSSAPHPHHHHHHHHHHGHLHLRGRSPSLRTLSSSHDHSKDKLAKHEKRRISHLNSEKKRRESIKGGMDALLELVPGCRDVRLSKANVLKEARDYIMELRGGWRELQIEIERQRRDNEELRRAIQVGHAQDHRGFICRL
ncbi:hypothetical protein C7212DRAFT_341514 [Tuber magnatum]|uniref:BHLH domain-containing protein n=1 Tax=Tuber magnatum TaxID=42249 RepID=A0A317SZN4_9PEZI|nr:hypothetical protein C7212DRAFT_341514 [Tuber magnatum]